MIVSPEDMAELRYLVHWQIERDRTDRCERMRLAGCVGKHKFESKLDAENSISHRLAKCTGHAYHCVGCGKWHVGTGHVERVKRISLQKLKGRE